MDTTQVPKAAKGKYTRSISARLKPQNPLNALQDNTPGQSDLARPSGRYLRVEQRKSRAVLAFVLMALLAGVALLPFGSRSPLVSVQTCAFKGATGLPCALCGGSRATQAALRGDFARACYLNMAALPSIAIVTSVTLLLAEAISGNAVIDWGRFAETDSTASAAFAGVLLLLLDRSSCRCGAPLRSPSSSTFAIRLPALSASGFWIRSGDLRSTSGSVKPTRPDQ